MVSWLLTTRIQCRALALSAVCTASACSASRSLEVDLKIGSRAWTCVVIFYGPVDQCWILLYHDDYIIFLTVSCWHHDN
jgi:hypothetical protein